LVLEKDSVGFLWAVQCAERKGRKADRLTGRYILATQRLEALIAQADRIVEQDLWTLRIRR
jgi:hypothetical protein